MRIYILFHASLFQSLLYVSISIYLLYNYPGCVFKYKSFQPGHEQCPSVNS